MPSIFIVAAADNVNRVDGVKIFRQNYLEATSRLITLELLAQKASVGQEENPGFDDLLSTATDLTCGETANKHNALNGFTQVRALLYL